MSEVTEVIQTMEHARVIIDDDILIMAELRARIEHQRVMICVALGYLQSGRPELAALVLGEKDTK